MGANIEREIEGAIWKDTDEKKKNYRKERRNFKKGKIHAKVWDIWTKAVRKEKKKSAKSFSRAGRKVSSF